MCVLSPACGTPPAEMQQDTLQQDLTEAVHEVPVEPLKAPPKVVHPFPGDSTKFQLMPPPIVPVKFAVRLNKVAKMKTGPPSTKTKMLGAITTPPCDNLQAVTRGSRVTHIISLAPPILELKNILIN